MTTNSHISPLWWRNVGSRCVHGDVALGSAEFRDRCSSLVVVVGGLESLAAETLGGPCSLLERVCLSSLRGRNAGGAFV